jgi:hypothetical protein
MTANSLHRKPIIHKPIPSKTEKSYSRPMNVDSDWRPEVDRLQTQLWALELRFAGFRLYVICAACTALTICILGTLITLS